jgi:hypothetical protein
LEHDPPDRNRPFRDDRRRRLHDLFNRPRVAVTEAMEMTLTYAVAAAVNLVVLVRIIRSRLTPNAVAGRRIR